MVVEVNRDVFRWILLISLKWSKRTLRIQFYCSELPFEYQVDLRNITSGNFSPAGPMFPTGSVCFMKTLLAVIIFRLDALAKALSVIATATWLGGWLAGSVSVTLRYCIKTAKPIGKLFQPSESSIILVF